MVCSCHENLSDIERESLFFLLLEFSDIFAGPQDMPGRTSKLKHFIDTGAAHHQCEEFPLQREEKLDEKMKKDVIQPSSSPWASPIVLVQKKDGSTRFCVDYRKLNSVTREDAYPLPRTGYITGFQMVQHTRPCKWLLASRAAQGLPRSYCIFHTQWTV